MQSHQKGVRKHFGSGLHMNPKSYQGGKQVQEPETIKNHNQRQVSNAGFGTSDKVEESPPNRVNRGIAETPSGA